MPSFKLLLACTEPGFIAAGGADKLVLNWTGETLSDLHKAIALACKIEEGSFNLSYFDSDFEETVHLRVFSEVTNKLKIDITRRVLSKRRCEIRCFLSKIPAMLFV